MYISVPLFLFVMNALVLLGLLLGFQSLEEKASKFFQAAVSAPIVINMTYFLYISISGR